MNCWVTPEMLACPNMNRALAAVQHNFDNPVPPTPPIPPERTVRAFWNSGDVGSFMELRCLCYSLEIVIRPQQQCLLDEPRNLNRLFALVRGQQGRLSKFLKCYQGLLACYLNHLHTANDPAGWADLQEFLAGEMHLFQKLSYQPFWLKTLFEYSQVLTPAPCERFSRDLAAGETEEFEEVCSSLGVMVESWIREEAVLAQVDATCRYPDAQFKEALGDLLNMISRESVRLSERIILKCLARLLIRYHDCADNEEHALLRDVAVRKIGNPWLDRPKWNVIVNNEPTRRMSTGGSSAGLSMIFSRCCLKTGLRTSVG
jgi:hypothetical protein